MVAERGAKQVNIAESPGGKDHLLRVLRGEADGFFKLAVGADDAGWHSPTPCEGWEVRDIVGHMVDVSQTYLGQYYSAMEDWPTPEPLGLRGYAQAIFEGSIALRPVPQYELIGRLKACWDRLYQIWEGMTDEQWAGLNIPHKYAGPVPQFMMVVFQLMDFTYHSWDIQKGLGQPASLGEEGAGFLVPYMIMLRQFTFAPERADGLAFTLGMEVNGPYGGTWRFGVKDNQLTVEEADTVGCQAVIRFKDAEDFCLRAYGRVELGQIEGDRGIADQFSGLFFGL